MSSESENSGGARRVGRRPFLLTAAAGAAASAVAVAASCSSSDNANATATTDADASTTTAAGVSATAGPRTSLPERGDGPLRVVIDSDAANEIDDQYALAFALLAPAELQIEAITAARSHSGTTWARFSRCRRNAAAAR